MEHVSSLTLGAYKEDSQIRHLVAIFFRQPEVIKNLLGLFLFYEIRHTVGIFNTSDEIR